MNKGIPSTSNRRLTIGYIAPSVSSVGQPMLNGVIDVAREQDVNLICFPGMSLTYGGFGTPKNIAFAMVSSQSVDGIVSWASMIGNYISVDELEAFHKQFHPLPVVTIGRTFENSPGVLMDSYEGMREAVAHLIEEHGHRRLAFIRGPEQHVYAQGRYQAYVETLEAHGVPSDPNLVTPAAPWGPDTGKEAIRLLLDERGLRPGDDLEAIISVSEDTLFGALEALETRQVRVPEDVAVVGFDDTILSQTHVPSVTTVAAPFYETGRAAAQNLLDVMKGVQVPKETIIPSQLMVRQSCGCLDMMIHQAAIGPVDSQDESIESILALRQDEILTAMRQTICPVSQSLGWEDRILHSFFDALKGASSDAFLLTLNNALRQVILDGGKVITWQGAISMLRRQVAPYLAGQTLRRAEDLWQQARTMIGEAAQRATNRKLRQSKETAQVEREIGTALITTFDLNDLADVLADRLPALGIPACYLSLYETAQPYQYPQPAPEWSRLLLAYKAVNLRDPSSSRQIEFKSGERRFRTLTLVPQDVLPQERQYSLVLQPLFFQQNQIGFILFEVGASQEGEVYETLSTQLSSALQASSLVQQLEVRKVQLSTAAEVSQVANSLLDPDDLIQQVVTLVQERFDLYYVGLFLVEEKWAVLQAATGKAGKKMIEQGHRLQIGGDSMIGRCISHHQAYVAADVGEEAVRFDNPLLPETRSELALPLVSREGALGALSIQSVQESAFGEEDVAIFQTMADQLANAIANARLYDKIQTAYAAVERQVQERTAQLQQEMTEREQAQEESARLQQEVIEAQQQAIQELSTPIIPILEGVIIVPLIGTIDTMRARDVTRNILTGIREHQAHVVIIDITGVPIVDSGVAAYLNKTIQAARLKGARAIVTGISEAVAETIVDLGIDWSGIETLGDLKTGLRAALRTR
jgi:DNA-binding LacI/PurR family transcriptional regulator/anti-anti-sigma regulatory factor/putative methionine-R-sulfoxide reductase with GAF domain